MTRPLRRPGTIRPAGTNCSVIRSRLAPIRAAASDLEILRHTDRVWASDTNDALERQAIQRWTGLLVPPELVGSHVGPPGTCWIVMRSRETRSTCTCEGVGGGGATGQNTGQGFINLAPWDERKGAENSANAIVERASGAEVPGREGLRPALELAIRYAHEQGLLPRSLSIDEAWEGSPAGLA